MASVFSKIIQGHLKGHVIYQDEVCFALLSIHPLHKGHVLLVPRDEVSDWLLLDLKTTNHLMRVGKSIGHLLKTTLTCKKIALMIVGLEVDHVHIHLVPVEGQENLDWSLAKRATDEELQEVARILFEAGADKIMR